MSDSNSTNSNFFGHPKGLFYLFFAELWERFSFYGMRALLILYMVNKVFESLVDRDAIAATIYASYGSLVYASPVIGGRLADKLLGYRNAILLGGILMTLGHLSLAFEYDTMFFLGLGFLIVGNGFFKPNISAFVGSLYPRGDKRQDSGFTIFYMGINIGGAIAPLLCGYLGFEYGWHWGFSLAAIGMLAGLIVFQQGIRKGVFENYGLPPHPANLNAINRLGSIGRALKLTNRRLIYLLALLAAPLMAYLVSTTQSLPVLGTTPVGFVFSALGIFILIYLGYIIVKSNPVERSQLIAALVLTLWMTVFWGFFELQGASLTLFAQRNVDLQFFNASQTNSVNSIVIILLAVPLSLLWVRLSRKKINPRSPYKFAFGLLWASLTFLVFYSSKFFANEEAQVPVLFLLLGYFCISAGELFMSPVGLSKITDLSPKRIAAFMMGVWFLSSTYGFQIVGIVGRWLAVDNVSGNNDPQVSLNVYTSGFFNIAIGLLVISLIALLTAPQVAKWMRDVH